MALNPITYTEKVVGDFLRYQLTTYPFADPGLYAQLRSLLSLEESRRTPLLKGPYISLSRPFREGATVADLVAEALLHPHMRQLVPFPNLYGHQEQAVRAIAARQPTIVSTGTGSGKTECFLYPVISRCLQLRDQQAPPGIVAVLVYPMNALAEDQLGRLRELLAGTGVTFGMYVGKTPEAEVGGMRLKAGASRADYLAAVAKEQAQGIGGRAVHPPEERASREAMRSPGAQPRILLTNVKQLELLLTRHRDVELFEGARLEYLVFDEAHTISGTAGAETACLVRRLRAFLGASVADTVCVATSATIADAARAGAGREFAARLFGVARDEVVYIGEEYEDEDWAAPGRRITDFKGDAATHLPYVLQALDREDPGPAVAQVVRAMVGRQISSGEGWREALFDLLAGHEAVFQLAMALQRPRSLLDLLDSVSKALGRTVTEEEALVWLALGAAARKDGRPLLRPVVHGFARGIPGAVVTFPEDQPGPRLWLSAEDEAGSGGVVQPRPAPQPGNAAGGESPTLFPLPVMTCSTCGQHYYWHFVKDLTVGPKGLGGGDAHGDAVVWPHLEESLGGNRVVLTDRLLTDGGDGNSGSDASDEDSRRDDGDAALPSRAHRTFFCRACGALHYEQVTICLSCGRAGALVPLLAVERSEKHAGFLTSCLSCGAQGRRPWGGRYREPARPVRAVTVSDVHVLAQNMIQYADRRRLLVFADNRQDAAFQAGWMRDHARRFRLRALMAQGIASAPGIGVGDLVAHLDAMLDADDELSRALAPEVWQMHRKAGEPLKHAEERRYFLRIQVLREVATGVKQRVGLEPWGRLRVDYRGLDPLLPFVQEWAPRIAADPADLAEGIAALLDVYRRGTHLLDRDGRLFSKFLREGAREIQRGYLPLLPGGPKGLKLVRSPGDRPGRVTQWLSSGGGTLAKQVVRGWGVPTEQVDEFLTGLWDLLVDDLHLFAPVTLESAAGKPLAGAAGAHQIDADLLELHPHRGLWRCSTCRRTQLRPGPNARCLAWRCAGTVHLEQENSDDYDLTVLDLTVSQGDFAMLRPAEHSAQVPDDVREALEMSFKDERQEQVNTLVATPTLELGVDIGALDTVLMRNVPPLPANYWQRVGRAGRRHRMAVNLTYARPASHDRAYFADPLKMLEGAVAPPQFNMRNPLLIRKHVHAAMLTRLHQLARAGGGPAEAQQREIAWALQHCFPTFVRGYLFDDDGHILSGAFDASALGAVVRTHESELLHHVVVAFSQGWPDEAADLVTVERLREELLGTTAHLAEVAGTLRRRLDWAMAQIARLQAVQRRKGALDADEEALHERCKRMIQRLKGGGGDRLAAEGYDERYTFAALAIEGFLPGYGLNAGAIVGNAQVPRFLSGSRDFTLPRPPALALREYVPGNLIYANANRFVARRYHLEPVEPALFQVDPAHEAIREVGVAAVPGGGPAVETLGATGLSAIPICDVDLPHVSHISDDEEFRFQMPVAVYGYEQGRHGTGTAFTWGDRALAFRRGVHLRLVNVGASRSVQAGELGYPLCLVCGQSRSPFSSQAEQDHFTKTHLERCGTPVRAVGFYADIVADALSLPDCADKTEAYSLAETLRQGMAAMLEMELEDLHVLVVGEPGAEFAHALLYDPMPGGSGLLDQALERWPEVVEAATVIAESCPAACERACIDCLWTFRNAYYHRHLDRHVAERRFAEWGPGLSFSHDIPAQAGSMPSHGVGEGAVNLAEQKLRHLLLAADFVEPVAQYPIALGKPYERTIPDFFYPGEDDGDPGVCIYLDGLSKHLHGNPETAAVDRSIRAELAGRGYLVIAIAATELDDQGAMTNHFRRLGRHLIGKDKADELKADASWFERAGDE